MSEIKTFDCEGCRGHCYGGYHMEECKDGYGDWVRKEDHEAAVAEGAKAALEEAVRVCEAEEKELRDNWPTTGGPAIIGVERCIRALKRQ